VKGQVSFGITVSSRHRMDLASGLCVPNVTYLCNKLYKKKKWMLCVGMENEVINWMYLKMQRLKLILKQFQFSHFFPLRDGVKHHTQICIFLT